MEQQIIELTLEEEKSIFGGEEDKWVLDENGNLIRILVI